MVGDAPELVRACTERYLPESCWRGASRTIARCGRAGSDGRAYVCRDFTCQAPVTDVDALVAQLASDPDRG